jgi:hypothetical protein
MGKERKSSAAVKTALALFVVGTRMILIPPAHIEAPQEIFGLMSAIGNDLRPRTEGANRIAGTLRSRRTPTRAGDGLQCGPATHGADIGETASCFGRVNWVPCGGSALAMNGDYLTS